MTPQEKAKELVEKFSPEVRGADRYNYNLEDMNVFIAKQCALIAVDEILTAITFNMYDEDAYNKEYNYWKEVKQELEKL